MKNIIFVCVDCLSNKIVRDLIDEGRFYYCIDGMNGERISQHVEIDENKYDVYKKIKKHAVYFPNAYAAACSTYMSLFSIFTGKFPAVVRKFDDFKQGFKDLFENVQYKKVKDYFSEYDVYSYVEPQEHADPISVFSNYYYDYGYAFKHDGEKKYIYKNKVLDDIHNIKNRLRKKDNNLIYLHLFALHNDFNITPFEDRIECINAYLEKLLIEFPVDKNNYVIFGDHGNAINSKDESDKNIFGHITHIVDEVINVPMFFIFKDDFVPQRINANVSLMDILPTILELNNKQLETEPIDLIYGQSLVNCIRNKKYDKHRFIYSRTLFPSQTYADANRNYYSKISVVSGNKKLILKSKKNDLNEYVCKINNKKCNFNIKFIKMMINAKRIEKEYYEITKNVYNEFGNSMWDNSNYSKIDIHNKKVDKLISIDFNQNDKVLILGCGYNKSNIKISEIVKETIAVDWQRSVFDYYDDTKINFMHSRIEDFAKNSYYTNYFNKILMDMVAHHIIYRVDDVNNFEQVKNVLQLYRRFLKTNGKIIIGEGLLPDISQEAYKFYNKVFAFKEIRHIFTEGVLEELLSECGYRNIYPIIFKRSMSIRNWLDNNILSDSVRKYIYNLHLNASDYIKQIYNMNIANNDITIDNKFMYLIGEK